jgi:hypothetical protein
MIWFPRKKELSTSLRFRELMQELEALEDGRRDEVALGLSLLWDAFNARFGGVDGVHTDPEAASNYLCELAESAERIRARPDSNRFYSLAPALMGIYVSCFLSRTDAPLQPDESATIARLIDRGRQIRAHPPPTPLARLLKPEQS